MRFPKKSCRIFREGTEVKYAFIKANEDFFKGQMMCEGLLVSRSGYYDWCNRGDSNHAKQDNLLAVEIKAIFDQEKQRPGSPRITRRLWAKGRKVGKNRVA